MELDLESLSNELYTKLEIKDRTYHLKTYKKTFIGSAAVQYLKSSGHAKSDEEALAIGQTLLEMGVIHHVTKDHPFKNEDLFYRFAKDEDFHGSVAPKPDGTTLSWADLFLRNDSHDSGWHKQPEIPSYDTSGFEQAEKDIGVSPLDEHNIKLLDNVHPAKWQDPEPQGKYNLVVIGAGTGGLVSAAGSAGLGAKVALIEEHLMGGDCLNVGCVPSKALIRCSRAAYEARNSERFGVTSTGVQVDFGKVMQRMRALRARISDHDSFHRFSKLGIDVFQGHAKFTGKDTVEVNGKTLRFSAAVIATGGTAAIPPIMGLKDVPYLTNASIFNLTELPARFGVIGAGPIGLELAQAMQRFGSAVTVMNRSARIMDKEDPEAADIVKAQMEKDGVVFKTRCTFLDVTRSESGAIRVRVCIEGAEVAGTEEVIEVDALLVATGRSPNVSKLALDVAGVDFDTKNGIKVNDNLRTSNDHIYAVGDCCTAYKFTHVADFMARIVIRNALFFGSGKMSSLLIPWATYTEPEVAHVGLYEADLQKAGIKYTTFKRNLDDVDRAICDGEEEGFCKIHVKAGSDEILGATIVAAHAGDLISEMTVAMQAKMGLGKLAGVIHPYPTQAECIRQTGDMYNRTKLTTFVKGLFRNILAWRRS